MLILTGKNMHAHIANYYIILSSLLKPYYKDPMVSSLVV